MFDFKIEKGCLLVKGSNQNLIYMEYVVLSWNVNIKTKDESAT